MVLKKYLKSSRSTYASREQISDLNLKHSMKYNLYETEYLIVYRLNPYIWSDAIYDLHKKHTTEKINQFILCMNRRLGDKIVVVA